MAKSIYATLIGDLVGSREAKSRGELQGALKHALHRVNEFLDPAQPLEPTVGDEFQGAFPEPLAAARASLLVRLELLKEAEVDARFGLGWGEVTVFESRSPLSQDGPGWWFARDAIERADDLSRWGRTDFVRTYLESSPLHDLPRGEIKAFNAFFFCRDALVAQMKPRSRRLLLGLLLGKSQAELAAEERISQSAVSQNLTASGAWAIRLAEAELTRNWLMRKRP
ncbi:MAG: SatD family protein [Solirubrobacterales bacterium]